MLKPIINLHNYLFGYQENIDYNSQNNLNSMPGEDLFKHVWSRV